jgi:hypothetical protein
VEASSIPFVCTAWKVARELSACGHVDDASSLDEAPFDEVAIDMEQNPFDEVAIDIWGEAWLIHI